MNGPAVAVGPSPFEARVLRAPQGDGALPEHRQDSDPPSGESRVV